MKIIFSYVIILAGDELGTKISRRLKRITKVFSVYFDIAELY